MYCKGCNSLLNDNNPICPKCGLDNNAITDETREIYINDVINPKDPKYKKNKLPLIITLIFILSVGIIGLYVIRDSKNTESDQPTTTTTIEIETPNKTFKFKSIKIKYLKDKYGTSTNTIFLKENNNIYISIKNVNAEEYSTIINSNDVLDSYLGDISTKTFAGEESYSHIFELNNDYYLIEVFDGRKDSLDEATQLELYRMINEITVS